MLCKYLRRPSNLIIPSSANTRRPLVGFITHAFNELDPERLQLVGAERLCAEWILKNGGKVRLLQHLPPPLPHDATAASRATANFFVDYNHLPPETVTIRVREIDATWSTVTAGGLVHLRDCAHIERIVLDECRKLHNDGMHHLLLVADTLRVLQISNCPGIVDSGLLQLAGLRRLRMLLCFQLPGVRDVAAVQRSLSEQLPPECELKMRPWEAPAVEND